eukprot:evm.model.scf_423.5 EVM.evm.TU.scf_423.5   scf_423:49058-49384(+)
MGLAAVHLMAEDTKVAGASAGSLIAGCFHSGVTKEGLMEGCRRVTVDCRENGTRGRLKAVLADVLDDILPDDCHTRCSGTSLLITFMQGLGCSFLPSIVRLLGSHWKK